MAAECPSVPCAVAKYELPRLYITLESQANEPMAKTFVHDGDVCRIGSHDSNDIVLVDPTISRFHCRLSLETGRWRITDTGSRNGTRLHGVRVLVAEVEEEAIIAIGDSTLRVRPAVRGDAKSVEVVESFGALVGTSGAMQQLYAVLSRVAASDIDVLRVSRLRSPSHLGVSMRTKRVFVGPLALVIPRAAALLAG